MDGMRYYVMVFLRTGNEPDDHEEKKRLQAGHMANMGRLHKEGKLILAGPFKDAGDLEGIFVFDTESLEEAQSWCDSDPAIAAGSLRVELLKWYSAKGIGIYPGGVPASEKT